MNLEPVKTTISLSYDGTQALSLSLPNQPLVTVLPKRPLTIDASVTAEDVFFVALDKLPSLSLKWTGNAFEQIQPNNNWQSAEAGDDWDCLFQRTAGGNTADVAIRVDIISSDPPHIGIVIVGTVESGENK